MNALDALLLGIVQGLTEFLPVSSSGHLKLMQYFLGMRDLDHYIIFDLVCHLGTLLAIVIVFFQNIKNAVLHTPYKIRQVIIATLPLFPLVLLMKPIKAAYADPAYLGYFFILTSLILFAGVKFGRSVSETVRKERTWSDALKIGLWQALAILPGVSRSGSTISGARLLGWNTNDAVVFSFFLAIPAILGGTTLELFKFFQHPENAAQISLINYFIGFVVSFAVGFFSLQLLIRLALQNKFYYFAWYCLFLGLATTFYFH